MKSMKETEMINREEDIVDIKLLERDIKIK